MNRTIVVVIDPKGQAVVETKGFQGTECRAASAFLEKALGEQLAETLTPAFHQAAPAVLAVAQRQG